MRSNSVRQSAARAAITASKKTGRPVDPQVEAVAAPHCNTEVLHAPGTCEFCDLYPDRQAMRTASGTPFTPAEANGWHGNVAQPRPRPPRMEAEPPCGPSFRQRLRNAMGLR